MLPALLSLIFIRPFISSLAFPCANSVYSAALLAFLTIWIIGKGISLNIIRNFKYPLALFLLALMVSVAFSQDKLNSLQESYKYISALALFLIIPALSHQDKIRLARTLIVAGLFISAIAVYQYFFGFRHVLTYLAGQKAPSDFALDYIQRKRVFAPFISPNILAGYLAMILPLTFIHKDRLFFLILISAALFLTKSLGALLCLFIGIVIYFYLRGKFKKRKIIFLIGLILILALTFLIRTAGQKQYLQPAFSTSMRLNYWRATLEMIKTCPLTGVGLGNFNLAQSRYAHNSYLQIWAEMGILGLISFLWLMGLIIKSALQNINNSAHKKEITCFLVAILIFLFHNFIDFTFFLPEVGLIWWAILGLSYTN